MGRIDILGLYDKIDWWASLFYLNIILAGIPVLFHYIHNINYMVYPGFMVIPGIIMVSSVFCMLNRYELNKDQGVE